MAPKNQQEEKGIWIKRTRERFDEEWTAAVKEEDDKKEREEAMPPPAEPVAAGGEHEDRAASLKFGRHVVSLKPSSFMPTRHTMVVEGRPVQVQPLFDGCGFFQRFQYESPWKSRSPRSPPL